jgi:membrane protein DedA with SNARE-associated domain
MIEFVDSLRAFIFEYPSFQYASIFFGSLIGGEVALFTLGFLIAQKVLNVFPVLVLSFVGAFLPNVLWYLLGNTAFVEKIVTYRYANSTVSMISDAVAKLSRNNHFFGLILIKFLVGTPILLTMYIHKTKMQFWPFIVYETPAIILSLLVIIPIGFVSGLGFKYFANILENIYVAIGFLLIIVLLITIVQSWFKNKLAKDLSTSDGL